MGVRTTGGVISSRYFHARELKRALAAMPSSQRKYVRNLAGRINDQTGIGYYSALDFVALMGVYFNEPHGKPSTQSAMANPPTSG